MAKLNDLLFALRCKRSALEQAEQDLRAARAAHDAAEAETVAAMRRVGLSAVHDLGVLWRIEGGRLSCSSVPVAYMVEVPDFPAGDHTGDGFDDDSVAVSIPVAAGRTA